MNERTKYILVFAGGVAVGVVLPIIIPAVLEGGRPLAKAVVKHASLAYQRVQVFVARMGETVEDLLAEVRSEARPSAVGAVVTPEVGPELHDKKVLS